LITSNPVTCGVGVIVADPQERILLMRRLSEHGKGEYSIPGGKLDAGENAEQSARRELAEETGLVARRLQFIGITNNLATYRKEGIHSISLIYYCNDYYGEAQVLEPDKHEQLSWFSLDALPKPLFEPCELGLQLLQQMKQGKGAGIVDPAG